MIYATDGMRLFHGELRIIPKDPRLEPFSEYGNFTFLPETGCWHGNGKEFKAELCEVIES